MKVISPQLMCLHIDGAKGETSVNVTLNTNNGAITLLERNLTEESFFSCDPFQVLGSIADNEDVATVSVSITSLGKVENKVSKVLLKRKRSKILIQTDKAVYKPGQHVKFRVMSLYENLLPCLQPDPGKNRIGQWLNVSVDQGIAEFSLPLSEEPPLGEYAIKVKDTEHTFSVEEYVLPRYDVKVQFPPVMFDSEVFSITIWVQLSAQSQTQVSTTLEKVSFVDADNSYKAGIPYTVKLKVVDGRGEPIPDKAVHLSYRNNNVTEQMSSVTDVNGRASFTVENTASWKENVIIEVMVKTNAHYWCPSLTTSQHVKAKIELSPFYSKSSSFLKLHSLENVLPCEGQQDVRVDYILKDPSLNPKVSHLDLHYLVGYTDVVFLLFSDIKGSTSFRFPHSVDSSPSLKVFVYVFLPRGEIVADLATFKVQKCFQNKVSVGFSRDEVLPGSDMSLQIQADPGSLCGLRVVDQSVTLMEPEKELTAEKVRYSLNKNSGSVVLHKSAPDTITDWKAGALCMGPSGFGLSPPTSLRVFKPFFVDVTMPSSVVRGETFVMKASVFNYMKECIKVQTTMGSSKELMEEPCDDCLRSSCLCSDESKTFTWNLKAMKLGEKCNVSRISLSDPVFIRRMGENTRQMFPACYQRQLTYKRDDGSYRMFVCLYNVTSERTIVFLLLCALCVKCITFIESVFVLQGGVEDEFSLTAYVTIALLESGVSTEDPMVGDALLCMKKAAPDMSNMYTQALMAYTFTLAGDTETRQSLLENLEKQAVRKDSQVHWERPSAKPRAKQSSWYRAASAEVELTAYMLMTSLSGPEKDLGRASEMVNWLSRQQNPYGGFSSTTDTVVALQSLAKYAEATFSDARDVTVTVRSQTGVQEFHVDKTNRLLLQKASLPDIPGDYTLTASGSGCVYVQTVLRYNVPPPRSDAAFAVRVEVKPDQCPGESVKKLQLNIHTEYTGSRAQSNMAIVEVKLLSGFIPVKSSKNKVIQRSDISMDMVTLYLNELKHESVHLPFMVEQDIEVKNLKPATVKVYDYYETGEYGIGEYNSPCSSGKETINILQRTLFMPGVSNLSPPDLLELHLP
uniref:Alpha-2-macroglobulin n=1 Tax=Leptobrachium leishanense TaxID=445787 RepID=A0A8C5QPB5_9ANUR